MKFFVATHIYPVVYMPLHMHHHDEILICSCFNVFNVFNFISNASCALSLRFTVPENVDREGQSDWPLVTEQLNETLTNLFNCNLYALPTKAFNTFDQTDKLKEREFAFLRVVIHFNTDIILW